MAAQQQQKKRGLPKRCSNAHAKEARKSGWLAGQKRKELRRQANLAAAQRNRALRAEGKLTPWEYAKATRPPRAGSQRQGYSYNSMAGAPGSETTYDRASREHYWRSLGRMVHSGARIRDTPVRSEESFGGWMKSRWERG